MPSARILWDVFGASSDLYLRTGGLVNPLIADALVEAGYDRSFDTMQTAEALAPLLLEHLDVPVLLILLRMPTGARYACRLVLISILAE